MTKHKIARKVASNSSPPSNNRIKLGDWLRDAYPEVWEQYCAIKDLEDAVEQPDPMLEHYKAHLQSLKQLETVKMSRWFKHGNI
jgi:GrpB-like predicted nucleotidyltransferase (UPF0157 family)